MTGDDIKETIAPCGLCCETCFAHAEGDIRKLSIQLQEKLGNIHIYAKRFETLLEESIFKKYPDFKEMLDYIVDLDGIAFPRHYRLQRRPQLKGQLSTAVPKPRTALFFSWFTAQFKREGLEKNENSRYTRDLSALGSLLLLQLYIAIYQLHLFSLHAIIIMMYLITRLSAWIGFSEEEY